jgi:hypothetical protein
VQLRDVRSLENPGESAVVGHRLCSEMFQKEVYVDVVVLSMTWKTG